MPLKPLRKNRLSKNINTKNNSETTDWQPRCYFLGIYLIALSDSQRIVDFFRKESNIEHFNHGVDIMEV